MQYGFYFDQTRCTGCYTCCVACKDWHDLPAGPANWLRVQSIEKGEYPNPFVASLFVPCYHCGDPACRNACPADAIIKREKDGIVIVNPDECLGRDSCGSCQDACPYHAPQFAGGDDPPMQKCDFCLDRWEEGKKPICVEACPMRALDAGPLPALEKKYGKVREAAGFAYASSLNPSIIFKNKGKRLKNKTL